MSTISIQLQDRELLELLLVEGATQRLSRHQRAELEHLQGKIPVDFDLESFERAATAIDLAFALEEDPDRSSNPRDGVPEIPRRLDRRLAELATDFAASARWRNDPRTEDYPCGPHPDDHGRTGSAATLLDFLGSDERKIASNPRLSSAGESNLPRSLASRSGWYVAAAALLAAALGWWPRLTQTTSPSAPPTPYEAALGSVVKTRTAGDVLVVVLQGTEDPAAVGASGTAEWSTETQGGFLRISGLAVNDPKTTQYQLWIFDREQDERYPVDGGVFDIPPAGDLGQAVTVPIDAKIPVGEPTLFAITVERPGGVVVSSRDRIVLAGAPA